MMRTQAKHVQATVADYYPCGNCAQPIIPCDLAGPACNTGFTHAGGTHLCSPASQYKGQVATLGRRDNWMIKNRARTCPKDCAAHEQHFVCLICRALAPATEGQQLPGRAGRYRCTDLFVCHVRARAGLERQARAGLERQAEEAGQR